MVPEGEWSPPGGVWSQGYGTTPYEQTLVKLLPSRNFVCRRKLKNKECLPPANEVREGYVFTDTPRPRADTPPEPTPPWGADPPWEQTAPETNTPPEDTPLRSACWEIRATSGRYASYWNTYL